jgi:hypothetical protein
MIDIKSVNIDLRTKSLAAGEVRRANLATQGIQKQLAQANKSLKRIQADIARTGRTHL